jgi:hypothetical protein
MELTLSWVARSWDKFSIWVTNQPTFVEVAIGIALFYVVLQIFKALFHIVAFLLGSLLATPSRFKKQKDLRPTKPSSKPITLDDDTPPFVFR